MAMYIPSCYQSDLHLLTTSRVLSVSFLNPIGKTILGTPIFAGRSINVPDYHFAEAVKIIRLLELKRPCKKMKLQNGSAATVRKRVKSLLL